jgi:AcrR family transcriptional regulator
MVTKNAKAEQAQATRERILAVAERLFAENGLHAVSNRQISEAAGQGNNTAVGYHFGTKTDLVRAIIRKHTGDIERLRHEMVSALGKRPDTRDWVACLVRPVTEHLAALGAPTWYARFGAQVLADPVCREIMLDEALSSPALREIVDGFNSCAPELPDDVRAERSDMARQLIEHVCAERERALADGTAVPRATWQETATGLIDAITGLWRAPVTTPST